MNILQKYFTNIADYKVEKLWKSKQIEHPEIIQAIVTSQHNTVYQRVSYGTFSRFVSISVESRY